MARYIVKGTRFTFFFFFSGFAAEGRREGWRAREGYIGVGGNIGHGYGYVACERERVCEFGSGFAGRPAPRPYIHT